MEASAIGGFNYSGFGNQESDSIINAINIAQSNEDKRSGLLRLQEMLHEEKTMLFLYFEKSRIAVNKRFKNVHEPIFTSGYDVTQFQLAEQN